jgi:phosphotransferase system enzyme I (PtsI)
MLAVDRGNEKISSLYNSLHPAVLRAIKQVIAAGHAAGISVGMCGEFASDARATRLLLGMGLDEFSICASESAEIKNIIRNSNYEDCRKLAERVTKEYRLDKILELIK